ncbi:SMC-Scp complex subunit ScpB [Hyphomicrobium sp.]|uniref:SMC-Scp complex subunit ScpB n=1 Tax=Hyphomicrobium sp. TaxID=82 RepID=UPI002FDD1F57
MVPPKLRVVTRDGVEDASVLDETEAPEAVELARALSEADAVAAGTAPTAEQRLEDQRIIEALLFASPTPVDEAWLADHLRHGSDIKALLADIKAVYATRGVNLVRVAGKWMFRTAEDLGYLLERHAVEERRLSRAALETLAIVAYHQPVTRAEIEDIRGVTTSAGTLDILMEAGWIRPRGRRRAPGKPLTYGTTESFLSHFGLDSVKDLPGLADLKAQGLLDGHLPPGFTVPDPSIAASLMPDELPLEDPEEEDADASADADGDDEDVSGESEAVGPPSGSDLPDGEGEGKPD